MITTQQFLVFLEILTLTALFFTSLAWMLKLLQDMRPCVQGGCAADAGALGRDFDLLRLAHPVGNTGITSTSNQNV